MVGVYQQIDGTLYHIAEGDEVTAEGLRLGYYFDQEGVLKCTLKHNTRSPDVQAADDPKDIFKGIDQSLLARFKVYHRNHPEIYKLFLSYVNQLRAAGRHCYSAWAIINRIRWDHDVAKKASPFKISNDYIALYARLAIYHHPELQDFFIIKKMKSYSDADVFFE